MCFPAAVTPILPNFGGSIALDSSADFSLDLANEYSGAVILLTGATGYLGGLVLENFLRNFPQVEKIYIAIRSKNGKAPHDRLQTLLRDSIFWNLRDRMNALLSKLEVLPVELEVENIGVAEDKRQELAERVTHVFHCASAIRFDLPINTVMRQNFVATENLLQLAQTWRRLRVWCYMSTAFTNVNLPRSSTIHEIIYPLAPSKENPKGVDGLALARGWMSLDDETAQRQALKFIKKYNFLNTYAISKNLTERLVMDYGMAKPGRVALPVCITRPAVVGAIAQQPHPGYVGNSSGLTGLILGGAYGITLKTTHSPDSKVPLIPADLVSQGTIVAAAAVAKGYPQRIYHICTSGTEDYTTLREVYDVTLEYARAALPKMPSLAPKNRDKWVSVWLSNPLHIAYTNTMLGAKVEAASTYLRWKGNQNLAKKLKMGWTAWKDINTKSKDWNFTFNIQGLQNLQEALRGEEATSMKCVWSRDLGDDWSVYLRSYTAGVAHLFLRTKPSEELMHWHNYRPVADRVKA